MKTQVLCFLMALLLGFSIPASAQSLIGVAGQSAQAGGTYISWSVGEPVIQTLVGSNVILTQGYQQPWDRYRVFGLLTYANAFSTPVRDIDVHIHPLGSPGSRSDRSNWDGYYYLHDLPNGDYTFTGSSNRPIGSVNATDALLVARHFVQQIQLTGIHKLAADVDASGAVNANDALQICRRYVDSILTFPAGDWLVSDDTLSLGIGTQQHDLQVLCYGDVNGSFVPGSTYKQSIYLQHEGEIHFPSAGEMLIPIFVRVDCEVGAISLVIQEPKGVLELLGIVLPEPKGDLTYTIRNSEIRMAWFSEEAINLKRTETLLWIRARLKDNASYLGSGISFALGIASEIADAAAWPYEHLELYIPNVKVDMVPDELSLADVFPNPATDKLHIRFGLPQDASIRLSTYNLHGAQLGQKAVYHLKAGIHEVEMDVTSLSTGLYFIQLEHTGRKPGMSLIRKFVVFRE